MSDTSRRGFLRQLAAAGIAALAGEGLGCGTRSPVLPGSPTAYKATATVQPTPRSLQSSQAMQRIRLPVPHTKGSVSLEETLARRHSVRSYKRDQPMEMALIAQLFWAAQGETRHWGGRTAPSAGALYPLEVYAATDRLLYRYVPSGHGADIAAEEDLRDALWAAGLRQHSLALAPVIFVITSVVQRTAARYGERAERYVHLEAGHAAENLLLQAVALGLGAVVIGAFRNEQIAGALHLADGESPLYLIPVGYRDE